MRNVHNEIACDSIVSMQWDFLHKKQEGNCCAHIGSGDISTRARMHETPLSISQHFPDWWHPKIALDHRYTKKSISSYTSLMKGKRVASAASLNSEGENGKPEHLLLCKIVVPKKRRRMLSYQALACN